MVGGNVVIVFGSRLLADNWTRNNSYDPKMVLLATEPEKIQGLMGPFTEVRFSPDVWSPTSYACEQKVKATEGWIVQDRHLRELVEKNDKKVGLVTSELSDRQLMRARYGGPRGGSPQLVRPKKEKS